MRISVIGQGYVGLTIAISAAKSGHEVTGFDNNSALATRLNSGDSHIEGVASADLHSAIKSGKYRATSNASEIKGSEIVIIAVQLHWTHTVHRILLFLNLHVNQLLLT